MNTKPLLIFLLLAVLLSIVVAITTPVGQNAAARAAAVISPVDDAWRAQLPKDPEAATQAYMARLSPQAKARSDAYFEGSYWLQLWGLLYGIGVAWLLLATRVSAGMRDFAERVTRFKPLHIMLYTVAYFLAGWLLALPLTIYQGYFREHQYGLANQTFAPWFGEQMISLAVALGISALVFAAIYRVIRAAPRTWWLWGACLGIVFLVIGILIAPIYIDPLFNTYKPLADGPVKQSILSMARANGVPADNVYQFDASKQSNRISANVSGIFGSAAVRLNDNLLERTSLPEIKGVMGHELGHYVLNHIYKFIVEFGVIIVIGFAFLRWSMAWAIARWGARWDVRGPGDTAGMPLLIALFSVYLFVLTPVTNTIVRVAEEEADIFGLNAAREGDGFAEVDLKLTEYRKADPGPVEEFILYDHPSPRKRIYSAMRWKAENLHY